MKKVLVVLSMLLIGLSIQGFGQTPLSYETILTFDSTYTKDIIYSKVYEWGVNNYISVNNVVQLSDKNNGVIIIKGL